MTNLAAFEVFGTNDAALFTLKISRGEGMTLLAMNWRSGTPMYDFVGFSIEYQEPGGNQFFALTNRLSFKDNQGNLNPNILSSRLSPIQKFRWVHFPYHTSLQGEYIYRVTPVFMNSSGLLTYGDFQQAGIQLLSETYPGVLNVTFTRGFVASQAFVDKFDNATATLLPKTAKNGLSFVSTNPLEASALQWMGFQARTSIFEVLDNAIGDTTAQVRVTAYDLNEPEIVSRLEKLGNRLQIIIDNSGSHLPPDSAESQAAEKLIAAGAAKVQRQKVGNLQHNKFIAVKGDQGNTAIGGSTNFSWRGFFVQNNNAVILHGIRAAEIFFTAFDNLYNHPNKAADFAKTDSAGWNDLQLPGISAKVAFSPHSTENALLDTIATDIDQTTSSVFYSLAFLYQTPGSILKSLEKITAEQNIFVYGLADKDVDGLELQKPDGNPPIVFPSVLLGGNLPEPFKAETAGGGGTRMHHKFVVIDFDKPTARVYTGSYNFSVAADTENGENLLLIQDRKVAVSYMIEAVSMFDHYEFRDAQAKSGQAGSKLYLRMPPKAGEVAWWEEDYQDPRKIRDRELFSSTF